MELKQVEYAVRDGIATLTLNRPDKLNAFTMRMQQELLECLRLAGADDDVRSVVVTGRGRGFCAGADLSSGPSVFDPSRSGAVVEARDGGGVVSLAIVDCPKPVIAAINGPAVGIGATMTLPMDFRLAAESARLGFVFTRRGLAPDGCCTWFLPRLVGTQQAADWLYTGRVFDAAEALRGGLVRSVHPDGELLDAAYALARSLADGTSAVSLALTRRLLHDGLRAPDPTVAHLAETRALQAMGPSADAAEGVAAFLEKRAPIFPMCVSDGLPQTLPRPRAWWDEGG
jgi:enoyl-CoA hydratase/carnithine racemase